MNYRLSTAFASFVVLALVASAASAQVVYSRGHADLGLGAGANLELHLHAGSNALIDGVALGGTGGEFAPDEVIVNVPYSTYSYVQANGGRNADPAYAAIGVPAGQSYWFLPSGGSLSGTLEAPHLGMGATDVDSGHFDNNMLYLRLTGMTGTGPAAGGHFSMWLAPDFYMSTVDGISALDQVAVGVGAHDHANWGFTMPGTYELTFEARAQVGGQWQTDVGTFTFNVQPVPEPATWMLGLSALAMLGIAVPRLRNR
jgi:surface-anchored protein